MAACTMLALTQETTPKLSLSELSTSDLTDLCWLQGPAASHPAVFQLCLRVGKAQMCRLQTQTNSNHITDSGSLTSTFAHLPTQELVHSL